MEQAQLSLPRKTTIFITHPFRTTGCSMPDRLRHVYQTLRLNVEAMMFAVTKYNLYNLYGKYTDTILNQVITDSNQCLTH